MRCCSDINTKPCRDSNLNTLHKTGASLDMLPTQGSYHSYKSVNFPFLKPSPAGRSVIRYDQLEDTWYTGAALPRFCDRFSGVHIKDTLYIGRIQDTGSRFCTLNLNPATMNYLSDEPNVLIRPVNRIFITDRYKIFHPILTNNKPIFQWDKAKKRI